MNDQHRKRKRAILILIILFLFLAIAGGDKLRDGRVSTASESADGSSSDVTSSTQVAGTSATPTSGVGTDAGNPESTPGSAVTPSNNPDGTVTLQSQDTPTGTPSPTLQPTPTPTPTVSVSPTPNPTPSATPIMTQTGVQGRMMINDNCPVMPDGTPMGTCLSRPYQGVASLYKSGSNAFVQQVVAQSDGAFLVMIEPGAYYFVHNGSPSLSPTYVTVPSNGFATVTLTFK